MIKGQWVKYKVYYEGGQIIPYRDSLEAWEYRYLDYYHMKTWGDYALNTFKEYITDQGVYTAEVHKVYQSRVPKKILREGADDLRRKIKEAKEDLKMHREELGELNK